MTSKLRALLDAKKGPENAQPVLQSETKPLYETTTQIAEKVEAARKSNILDRLKKPASTGSFSGGNREIVEARPETIPAAITVVEPGPVIPTMPAGLSMMQQMKWKKENAPKDAPAIAVNSNTENSVGQNQPVQQTENKTVSEPIKELSASQTADALKQNDGTANIAELKSNLEYLAANIENGPLVKDIVRTIATQVAQHPEIAKHMTRGEVNLMVRGLRSSYQVAAMNKQEKVDKKKKTDKGVDEIAQFMKDSGFSFKLG